MEINVVAVSAVERVSKVNFHEIAHADPKKRPGNMPFETPGVVVDHAGSYFTLGFANGPMDHFATLIFARDGRWNIWSEGPTRVLAGQFGFWHKDEVMLVLLWCLA